MNIFIDESGNFVSGINVICSIIIPETIAGYVERKYQDFEKGVPRDELTDGEVKGFGLSFDSRMKFFDFLNQYKEIKITPATIDLDLQEENIMTDFFNYVHNDYKTGISQAILNKDENRRKELSKRLKTYNQSPTLFIHQLLLVANLYKTFDHLLVYYLDRKYDFCFERIKIMIDRKNPTGLTNYEKLTRDGLPMFFQNISKKQPLGIVAEAWTADHPFRRNFECEEGIDVSKICKDNIQFKDSKTEKFLRIVDIVVNSFSLCLKRILDPDEEDMLYAKISNNLATGPKVGPNFILIGNEEKDPKVKVPSKYLKFYRQCS